MNMNSILLNGAEAATDGFKTRRAIPA